MRACKLACLTVGLSLATTDLARPRTIPGEPEAMEKNASLKKKNDLEHKHISQ